MKKMPVISKTKQVEWLLSLISLLNDVIALLQGVLRRLL